MKKALFSLFLGSGMLLASCEKKELPITLPTAPATSGGGSSQATVQQAMVELGEDYQKQIYFSLEKNSVVGTFSIQSWDLAFESGESGFHIFMNGGRNDLIYPTGKTSMADVRPDNTDTSDDSKNIDKTWVSDDPDGLPEHSGLGDWRGSGQVYIMSTPNGNYKFRLLSCNALGYAMEYAPLGSSQPQTVTVPKDASYNFVHFSFDNPIHLLHAEPMRDSWDLLFTHYREALPYNGGFLRYIVTGALLNPYQTTGTQDSTSGYTGITASKADSYRFVPNRNVIGYDWKSFDYTSSTARYIVNPKKCYLVRNQEGRVFKLHFLDFYNAAGVKGSPSFEYERLK